MILNPTRKWTFILRPRAKARTQRVCGLDRWFKALDLSRFKNAHGLKAGELSGLYGPWSREYDLTPHHRGLEVKRVRGLEG